MKGKKQKKKRQNQNKTGQEKNHNEKKPAGESIYKRKRKYNITTCGLLGWLVS